MFYLIIAIVCGSLFSVLFKLFQQNGVNVQQTIFFNYATGVLVAWSPIAFDLVRNGGTNVVEYQLPTTTLLVSLFQGILFMVGFIAMNSSTFRCGVALTTATARFSLILPVILSWLFLSQPAPSWLPASMVLIALLMIILPNEQQKHGDMSAHPGPHTRRKREAVWSLIGVFIIYGISDFSLKVAQHYVTLSANADADLASHRLSSLTGTIFIMASLVSLVTCFIKGSFREQRIGWRTITGGLLLGTANLCCTACMLKALESMTTGLFYPVYNIGIVIVSTVIGLLFFKERIKPIQALGLLIAASAIAMFFS